MGRAPKSTGASKAAVTSANTTEMNLSDNCIVAYNPDVAGKNNDELYRAEYPDGATNFIHGQKHNKIRLFPLLQYDFFSSSVIGLQIYKH